MAGVAGAVAWYMARLDRRPLSTKFLSTAFLGLFSECISRQLTAAAFCAQASGYLRTSLLLALETPLLHFWLQLLGRIFRRWDSGRLVTVLAKLAVHELIYDPGFAAAYMYCQRRLAGSHREAVAHLHGHWGADVRWNWKIWPAAQLVNFLYVPGRLSVLFINLSASSWTPS